MSKKILIVLAIPLIVIVLVAVLVPLLVDEQKLLDMATDKLKSETGATLTVNGGMSLSFFPSVSLDVREAGVTLPGEQEKSVSARSISVGLELLPLFSGAVEIGEVVVDGLHVIVQATPEEPALDTSTLSDDQLDAFYAKRRKEQEEAGQANGQEAVLTAPLALNVKRLSLTDAVLETIAAETGEVSRIELLSLEGRDLNLQDRSIPLQVKLRVPGDAEAAPIDVGLAGDVRMDAQGQKLTLESLEVVVEGVLADPVVLEATGLVDIVAQAADVELKLSLGDTRGEGTLRYASFETPVISADLHLNQFDPALVVLAGPDAAQAADTKPATTDGTAAGQGDEPLPLNALRSIDTQASLVIDEAIFSGHTVENMRVRLRAVDGVFRINKLSGSLHDGKLDMKGVFNGQHNVARLNLNGGIVGLDVAKALKAMESEPILTGNADLEFRLASKGSTSNELIEAMNGPIEITTSEIVLQNLGIEKMLCEAVALVNRESMEKTLPERSKFRTLTASLKMNRGKLRMKPLRAELAHVKLTGEGGFDILEGKFAATFSASLEPSLAKLDPACRVNDRYTSIDWPVSCRGDLTGEPADWCGVDTQEIIEQMAKGEVKRKVEKEAGRFLDKLIKD